MKDGFVAARRRENTNRAGEAEGDSLALHSQEQQRRYLVALVAAAFVAALPFPWLFHSRYVGSADLHGAIEMCGALIALAAGLALMARFYALANRFYLFTGLAFFINGAEDLVHGFAEFASHHGWIGVPRSSLDQFIPGTYVTGRILMAVLLIWAALAAVRSSKAENTKRETLWASLSVLAGGTVLTIVAFLIPLPGFVHYERVISRPVDLASAVLFALALVFLLHRYVRTRHAMTWWICLSTVLNLVGQLDMSFSRGMYDPHFDMAHACKVLGYLTPLLGFCLCQVGVIRDGRRAREALAAQKEHLAVTLRSIGDAVIATDIKGRIIEINAVAESLTGWAREAALGMPLTEVFHIINEQTGQRCEDPVAKVLRSGIVVGLANHTALISRDGVQRSIADSGAPIRDEGGHVVGVVLVFRDITEQKRAEEELTLYREHLERMVEQRTGELRHINEQLRTEAAERERSEEALRKSEMQTRFQAEMLRNAPVIAAFHDTELNVVWANKAYEGATGMSAQAMAGKKCYSVWGLSGPCRHCPVSEAIKTGEAGEAELTPQNQEHWPETQGYWLSRAAPVRDADGRILGAIEIAINITDKKRAEERERLAREVLERLNDPENTVDAIRDILLMVKKGTGIEAVGIRIREGDDFPYYETSGFSDEFVHSENHLCARDKAGDIVRDAQGHPVLECMCGNILRGRTNSALPFFTEGGSFWSNCTTELLASTTEKEREAATRNRCNGAGYESVALIPLRSGREIIGLLQLNDHRRNQFTPAIIRFFEGLGDSIGIAISRTRAEEALKQYSEKLEEMVQARTKELRDAQEQMVRKEKLALLGQLAGGVGHELRNPLGAIKNAAYFLNMVLEKPEPEVKETIQILDREVANCERIIAGLLNFARPKPAPLRKVNVGDVIAETLSRVTVPSDIEVANRPDRPLPAVLADSDQLVQVFGNIVLNAFQAMPQGGRLTIRSAVPSPEWVALSFVDTGVGIPQENLTKIFEPLFTTKAKGIGFGLAVTKSIVEAHGGSIEVQSEPGKGTTFTVRLPVCREEA